MSVVEPYVCVFDKFIGERGMHVVFVASVDVVVVVVLAALITMSQLPTNAIRLIGMRVSLRMTQS